MRARDLVLVLVGLLACRRDPSITPLVAESTAPRRVEATSGSSAVAPDGGSSIHTPPIATGQSTQQGSQQSWPQGSQQSWPQGSQQSWPQAAQQGSQQSSPQSTQQGSPQSSYSQPLAHGGPLALREEARVRLQPLRARTSGNQVEGTVSGVAFYGERSELLIGGGNDDRIHIAEIASGREIWASPSLGKDVEAVAGCGDRVAAVIYYNRLRIFRRTGDRRFAAHTGDLGGGSEWLAFTEDCAYILTPTFLSELNIIDGDGRRVAELPSSGYRNFGYGARSTVYRRQDPKSTERREVYYRYSWAGSPGRGTTEALPYTHEDPILGRLVQVQPTATGGLLLEYCDRTRCRVIVEERGVAVDFAVTGGVWSLDLGSHLAVSADVGVLAWYRDGLPVQIVELSSGRRAELPKVPRTMSATVHFAFDPRDPRRIAVAMHPAPNMVTVLRIGDGA